MKRDPSCRLILVLLASLAGSAAVLADYSLPGGALSGEASAKSRPDIAAPARASRGPGAVSARLLAGRSAARRRDSSPAPSDGKEAQSGSSAADSPTTQDLCAGVT